MDEKENVSAAEAENTVASEEKLYSERELNELLESRMSELRKKLAETEKLALMDAEEKVKYRREMAEKELAQREAAVAKRELMAAAIESLRRPTFRSSLLPAFATTAKRNATEVFWQFPKPSERQLQGLLTSV